MVEITVKPTDPCAVRCRPGTQKNLCDKLGEPTAVVIQTAAQSRQAIDWLETLQAPAPHLIHAIAATLSRADLANEDKPMQESRPAKHGRTS